MKARHLLLVLPLALVAWMVWGGAAGVGGGAGSVPGSGSGSGGATTNASDLTTGTLPDARLSTNIPVMVNYALPAVDGSALTNLSAANAIAKTNGTGYWPVIAGQTNIASSQNYLTLASTWTSNTTYAADFLFKQSWVWQDTYDHDHPDIQTIFGYNIPATPGYNLNEPSFYRSLESRWQNGNGYEQLEDYDLFYSPTNGYGTNYSFRPRSFTSQWIVSGDATHQTFTGSEYTLESDVMLFRKPNATTADPLRFDLSEGSAGVTLKGLLIITTNASGVGYIDLQGQYISLNRAGGGNATFIGTDFSGNFLGAPHTFIMGFHNNKSLLIGGTFTNIALTETQLWVPNLAGNGTGVTNHGGGNVAGNLVWTNTTTGPVGNGGGLSNLATVLSGSGGVTVTKTGMDTWSISGTNSGGGATNVLIGSVATINSSPYYLNVQTNGDGDFSLSTDFDPQPASAYLTNVTTGASNRYVGTFVSVDGSNHLSEVTGDSWSINADGDATFAKLTANGVVALNAATSVGDLLTAEAGLVATNVQTAGFTNNGTARFNGDVSASGVFTGNGSGLTNLNNGGGSGLIGSDASGVTLDVDTVSELETAVGGANLLTSTETDTSAELAGILADELGNAGKIVLADVTSHTAGDTIVWDGSKFTNAPFGSAVTVAAGTNGIAVTSSGGNYTVHDTGVKSYLSVTGRMDVAEMYPTNLYTLLTNKAALATDANGKIIEGTAGSSVTGMKTNTFTTFTDTGTITGTVYVAAATTLTNASNILAGDGRGALLASWTNLSDIPAGFADGVDAEGGAGGTTNVVNNGSQVLVTDPAGDTGLDLSATLTRLYVPGDSPILSGSQVGGTNLTGIDPPVGSSALIRVAGNLGRIDLVTTNKVVVTGNLEVSGSTSFSSLTATQLNIGQAYITNATFTTSNQFHGAFVGNGAGLTNLNATNVSGTISAAINAINATNNYGNSTTATTATNAVNATNFWGTLNSTNYGTRYEEVWIPANAMNPGTNAGPAAATNTWSTTTDGQAIEAWDFDADTDEAVQFLFTMPENWNAGTVNAKVYWRAVNAVILTNTWAIQGGGLGAGDVAGNSLGTAVIITNAASDAITKLNISSWSPALTLGSNAVPGNLTWFKFYRDANGTGDTLTNDARLFGIKLKYAVTNSIAAP